MPGVGPMKVIKVGNSSQSRVAQACDRCRSKKIRCDGIQPTCSQCANVGFECRTSDKLSRRAFPRGYTESLEERVRALEAESRELKGLLDEKDQKLATLSQSPPFSSTPAGFPSCSPRRPGTQNQNAPFMEVDDEVIRVEYVSSSRAPSWESPYRGPSSTRAFTDAFMERLDKRYGRPTSSISFDAMLAPTPMAFRSPQGSIPPKFVSDQLMRIFVQEWFPLYPVVHYTALSNNYALYSNDPRSVGDKYILSQMNLMLGIGALSSHSRIPMDPLVFEQNSRLEMMTDDISMPALQCLVLAQIYYCVKLDYRNMLRYRSLSVAICLQLGLHQNQRRFSLDPLERQLRKKVFWCQYTLDRFAAALTGLPVLIADSDISTEFPVDIDDEPTDAHTTVISNAIALFSAAKILSTVLDKLYSSPAGCEVPLSTIHSLAGELDDWLRQLPGHLHFESVHDKQNDEPLVNRSPILAIVYHFIRTLIRRPAACYGKNENASSSMLSLVESSKQIIQTLKFLEDRRMCFSLAINRRELIAISGLGLLWQSMDLNPDSRLIRESQKVLKMAFPLLESESPQACAQFGAMVNHFMPGGDQQRRPSESPAQKLRQQLSFSSDISMYSHKQTNVSSPELSRSVRSSTSPSGISDMPGPGVRHRSDPSISSMNFDYNQFHGEKKIIPAAIEGEMGPQDWELVLGSMDSGHANIYNGIYGGSECGDAPGAFAALAAAQYRRASQQAHQQAQPHGLAGAGQPTVAQVTWPPHDWTGGAGPSPPQHKHGSPQVMMNDPYTTMMIGHQLEGIGEPGETETWVQSVNL